MLKICVDVEFIVLIETLYLVLRLSAHSVAFDNPDVEVASVDKASEVL